MNKSRENDYIDLGVMIVDIWKGLKRYWMGILLCAFIGAIALYTYNYYIYVPMYRANASFTVKTTGSGLSNEVNTIYGFYYDKNTADQIERTFPYILSSSILQKRLCEEVGVPYINGSVSAQVIQNSNLVTLSVTSRSMRDAKKILESVIVVYPEVAQYVLGGIEFEFLNEPEVQDTPINLPNDKKIFAQGALVGLVLGMGALLVYALMLKTIRTENDLKKALSTECLGMIPEVKDKKNLLTESWKHKSRYQEDLFSIQNRLDFLMKKNQQKVLLVTSTAPAEGKTTVAINLAIAMAQRGEKVLLLDGDLRKCDIKEKLGCEYNELTMKDVLSGKAELKDAAKYLEEEGIYVLGYHKTIRNTINIIHSKGMESLIEQAKMFANVVIIDAPSCGMLADAGQYYKYADGVLFVVRQDWVDASAVMDAVSDLPQGGEKLLGCVLNRVKTGFASYGYGYSSYGYGYRYDKYKHYKNYKVK